jgi:hypothetical protein
MALVEITGERYDEPSLLRLSGELILQQPCEKGPSSTMTNEAKACFQNSIALARKQGAMSVELQGTLSLAPLQQHQDKKDAARQTLAEIHGKFTEGFDTIDWGEARALL